MKIEIDCDDICQAIDRLTEINKDGNLMQELNEAEECDSFYLPWGIITK